jgi:CRISPR-associated exonuclease Cas4
VEFYNDEQYLMLSGIQHFMFCRRQWALIHIEQSWSENYLTASGRIMHERAHNGHLTEKRGDTLTVRALKISSHRLGLSGECDVVEFHSLPDGINLFGHKGLWIPYPVEYKRGNGSSKDADSLQLCAQAICLEEMLACEITCGALYYGENHRRTPVDFTDELRQKVFDFATEMHNLFELGHIPKVKTGKQCKSCSLADVCLTQMSKKTSAISYMENRLFEISEGENAV